MTLQNAAAALLTTRFGMGHWSTIVTDTGTVRAMQHARVRVGVAGRRVITVLRLATKKPWAIDASYFTKVKRALYLTNMAVAVEEQRRGMGRLALEDARRVAMDERADAIRLDSYDAEAGAGPFYSKCGFTERGRVTYRSVPLTYHELLLTRT